MPVYSIIVPVYKAEKYLAECLESILTQDTESEYEVILVDDGSPDNSGAICDDYAARHENIRVIHKANGGVSSARNAGIKAAEGTYVLFCDSDDLYKPGYLSVLDPFLAKQPDMIQTCACMFSEDGECGELRPKLAPRPDGEPGQAYLKRCLAADVLPMYGPYYYAYRREFLVKNALVFPEELSVNEDLDFIMQGIPAAQMICGIDYVGYLYRQHSESIVHTPSPAKAMMRLTATSKWFRRYPCHAFADLFILSSVSISEVGTRQEVRELADFCRKNKDIWKYAKDWRTKLAAWLFRLFGTYSGSVIFTWLIHTKHTILRRDIS